MLTRFLRGLEFPDRVKSKKKFHLSIKPRLLLSWFFRACSRHPIKMRWCFAFRPLQENVFLLHHGKLVKLFVIFPQRRWCGTKSWKSNLQGVPLHAFFIEMVLHKCATEVMLVWSIFFQEWIWFVREDDFHCYVLMFSTLFCFSKWKQFPNFLYKEDSHRIGGAPRTIVAVFYIREKHISLWKTCHCTNK